MMASRRSSIFLAATWEVSGLPLASVNVSAVDRLEEAEAMPGWNTG